VTKFSAELIPVRCETLLSGIHKLINSVCNKEELPDQWKESIIVVPVHKKGDKTDNNNYPAISLLSASYKMLSNIFLSRSSPYIDGVIGNHQCGLDVTDKLLIKAFAFVRYWRKNRLQESPWFS
jgi:hypothetical protein